ncbi:MAG: thiamine monophosphate synthase [Cognaticolwellia sp.]
MVLSRGELDPLLAVVSVGSLDVLIREPDLDPPTVEVWLSALQAAGARVRLHLKTPGAEVLARRHGIAVHLASHVEAAPKGLRFSQSCHSVAQARGAFERGAEFVFLSPAFRPHSKPLDKRETWGVERLAKAQEELGPVLALGGITPERAMALREEGVHGVAVLGGIWQASDSVERVRSLLAATSR